MKLYVGNLSFSTTEHELRDLFAAHGTVTDVHVVTDRMSGQSRGFAFVTMGNRSDSLLIVSDNGQERLAGPDSGLKKSDLLREVMDQFQVHGLRVKPSIGSELRAGQG